MAPPRPPLTALLLLVTAAGCSGGGSGSTAGSTAAPATSGTTAAVQTAAAPAARWWSGDFHVHTDHSGDGVDTVGQTIGLAKLVGLDFVALTDHETLSQRQDPAFLPTSDFGVVGGYEWTDMVHMGLIGGASVTPGLSGDPADYPAIVQGLIDDVHAEGGAAILYHPAWNHFPWLYDVSRFDAIEVWNNFWTLSDSGMHPSDLQDVQSRLDAGLAAAGISPSAELMAALSAPGGGNDRALFYWEEFLEQGEQVAAVGGSDRHKILPPGYPTTWVLSPTRSEADLVAGVRAGRTYVTQGPDGPFVEFEVDSDGDGVFETKLGDTLPAGRPLTVRARVRGATDGLLRVVRRRHIEHESPIVSADFTATFSLTPSSGDWLRVDVYQRVDWNVPFGNQAAQLASSPGSGNVQALISLWGVGVTIGTNFPAVTLDERYRRLANLEILEPTWSRAAITSPIYVR